MSRLKISPSSLKGAIRIPPSKSHTMRAILLGSLGKGRSIITDFLPSSDTFSMISAMRAFGVKIEIEGNKMVIDGLGGQLFPPKDVIDAGNSGQILRFVGSLAALLPTYTIITGDDSIRSRRPVQPLLSALTQLGALAVSSRLNGRAPIIVRGPLHPGKASLLGVDSQPISGLLITASFLEGVTHLEVIHPGERPWIDLTLDWLTRLGGQISHDHYERYTIKGPLKYDGFVYQVPGDFSSAAFPIISALITRSEVTLENIDFEEIQGDKKIVSVLEQMGARFEKDPKQRRLIIKPINSLQGIEIDANPIIDAIPLLAVIGCFAAGKTEIFGGEIARHKESDRIGAITEELKKMGAHIEEKRDGLIVNPSRLKGNLLSSHQDHRIAMALAVAGLAADGESLIEGAGCIAKSYPNFIQDFQRIGAQIINW